MGSTPMPNPTMDERAEFEGSFSYSIGVMLSMSRLYFDQGATLAEAVGGPIPEYAASDALFEMLLVRLRAFDSFFGCIGNIATDAHATDWSPGWQPRGVLIGTERADINKRLAHLTYRQPPVHEWPIGEMVRRCADRVDAFLDLLSTAAPQPWQQRHAEVDRFVKDHSARKWEQIWTENDNHAHRRA